VRRRRRHERKADFLQWHVSAAQQRRPTGRKANSAPFSLQPLSFSLFMKTPREILLARHRAIEPRLDAIRHTVVQELAQTAAHFEKEKFSREAREGREGSFQRDITEGRVPRVPIISSFVIRHLSLSQLLKTLWREIISPCRRVWGGLAAAWLVILAVNLAQREPGQPDLTPAAAREMAGRLRDQQRLLNELFASRTPTPDMEAPRLFIPQPRTEIIQILMV